MHEGILEDSQSDVLKEARSGRMMDVRHSNLNRMHFVVMIND
jgi:hypothetical protein